MMLLYSLPFSHPTQVSDGDWGGWLSRFEHFVYTEEVEGFQSLSVHQTGHNQEPSC